MSYHVDLLLVVLVLLQSNSTKGKSFTYSTVSRHLLIKAIIKQEGRVEGKRLLGRKRCSMLDFVKQQEEGREGGRREEEKRLL